ncbi:MAG TPA: hypothetical protein VE685_27810 [Thermoanaerobaculia bacterium]|nr:hypothetical protein [Thermoanaerobaculia bacterium]
MDLYGRLKSIDEDLERIAARLAPLRRVCTALGCSVWAYAITAWLLVDYRGTRPLAEIPDPVLLSLTGLTATLILLSSRVRTMILRRALPRNPALPINGDAVLGAYQRGTLLSFALLETAAVLGLLIALLAGRSSYGIVLCGAALIGMLTRWPREVEADRLMRGKASP